MKGFSEKEINNIFGNKDEPKPKKKNRKIKKYIPHIATGAILAVVAAAIIIPLTTLKSDQKPDTNEKYEISPIEDFKYSITDGSVTIDKYIGEGGTVVVPDRIDNVPVKNIGIDSFSDNDTLERVILPEGLAKIEENAFSGGGGLVMVHLPNTLESIGSKTFFDCTALEEITVPESVTFIGEGAFEGCSKLTKVNIPENITEIPAGLFKNCSDLSEIKLPENTVSIGNSAFAGTFLKEIYLPSTLVSIGEEAFANTDISAITLPDSLEELGVSAFSNCLNLSEITIPEKVTEINITTFYNCSNLSNVVLHDGITGIGNGAFQECTSLEKLNFSSSLKEIGATAFEKCENLNYVTLPTSLEKIGNSAFKQSGIIEIKLPDSVTSIGEECFYMCTSLRTVKLSDSLESIEASAFGYCSLLSSVDIPASVKSIDDGAFKQCYNLAEISFSEGLETIGAAAFSGCKNIKNVVLPESLKNLSPKNTFNKCTYLKEVVLPEGLETFDYSDGVSFGIFMDCEALERIYFPASFKDEKIGGILCEVDAGVVEIAEGNKMFAKSEGSIISKDGTYLYLLSRDTEIVSGEYYTEKRFYTLPSSVTSASEYAFVNTPYGSYIITTESFKGTNTDKYTFINDDFVIGTFKADTMSFNIELSENIRDAFLDLSKTDPRFSIKHHLDSWIQLEIVGDSDGFSTPLKLDYEDEVFEDHYIAYFYPLKNKDKFSSQSEGYVVAPKTYYSEFIGEYGISFTTTIENDTFYDTNELTDYFLISYLDMGVQYENENQKAISDEYDAILERNGLMKAHDGFAYSSSTMSSEYGEAKTITFESHFFDTKLRSVLIEVYPVGYYGDNGEKVLTSPDGKISYSIRIVDTESEKFYY